MSTLKEDTIKKILEVGIADEEDFKLLEGLIGFSRFSIPDENFWGILLDETHFIVANNILEFFPNRTWGRVAIHSNHNMDIDKSIKEFKDYDKKGGI